MTTKQNTTKTLRENKLLLRMQGWKDTLSYKHISVLFWQRYIAFGITHFTHFVTSTVLNMKRNTVCWRQIDESTMFRRPVVKNTKLWRPINIHTTFLRPINKSTKFRRPINNQTHQQKHNILGTDQQNTAFRTLIDKKSTFRKQILSPTCVVLFNMGRWKLSINKIIPNGSLRFLQFPMNLMLNNWARSTIKQNLSWEGNSWTGR